MKKNILKPKFNILLIAAAICVFVINYSNLFSVQHVISSKGKEFWIAFPPNFHTGGSIIYDSLFIYIAADVATSGTIEYYTIPNNKRSVAFNITDPSKIYTFKVLAEDAELQAISEQVSNFAFHIISNDDVMVYANSQASMTSDATMLLPVDALANDYFVMSYYSDGLNPQRTPSQFSIVATEDSTSVTIIPSTETQNHRKLTQNFILNKGNAYLVQALIDGANLNRDLTGTEIKSNKPIAVYGSHQRASIPYTEGNEGASRDYLLECIPPLNTWGKSIFLTPFIPATDPTNPANNQTSFGNDIYRILAANDSTIITINGVNHILQKGEFYENNLINPAIVSSNNPILVAQFKKSSNATALDHSGGSSKIGDPLMMIIPPKEQYMNSYKVINAQSVQFNNFLQNSYTEQYITVVVPDSAKNKIYLDGNLIPASNFISIPAANYSYANIKTSDGQHNANSTANFGIYIYGYGPANSYGYVGGMSFIPLQADPPEVYAFNNCYTARVAIFDTSTNQNGVYFASSPTVSQQNVTVQMIPFTPLADSVIFFAKLIDKKLDGSFDVTAIDSLGGKVTKTINITGFTLSIDKFELLDTVISYNKNGRKNKQYCFSLVLHNYGKLIRTIDSLFFDNPNFQISSGFLSVLQPDERDTITVCAEFSDIGVYIDSLLLATDCDSKYLAKFMFEIKENNIPPQFTVSGDSCNQTRNILIADTVTIDAGIKKIDILRNDNCTITSNIDVGGLFAHSQIRVNDPLKDAIYSISVSDSTGLSVTITDTIQGFTLSTPDGSSVDIGSRKIGNLYEDSVKVYNSGLAPMIINDVQLKTGTIFSVPLSQFPMTINPNEFKYIKFYFNPQNYNKADVTDEILIPFNCIDLQINIKGLAILDYVYDATTKCNVLIKLKENKIVSSTYLQQNYPNPAADLTNINFGLASELNIRLDIFDMLGNLNQNILSGDYSAGDYEVQFDAINLPQGLYLIKLQTANEVITKIMIIEK